MKRLLTLLLLTATTAHATPVKTLFGTQRFTPNNAHTVTGPLVQFQTPDGTTLSFQQGARFTIADNGTVTLTSGNLRVGPAGDQPLTVNLPQGPITVDPLTALTITADNTQSTGRVYHGNMRAEDRTFTTGEGFVIKPSGARGTFTPAPAQTPTPLSVEPAAGPTQSQTPPLNQQPSYQPPATTAQLPQQPSQPEDPATPPVSNPEPPETTEPPVTNPPETEPPVTTDPEIPTTPEPEPETQPEPEPEPEAEIPTPIIRSGLLASFSDAELNQSAPDNIHAIPSTFQLSEYQNGTQTLDETRTNYFNITTSSLLRGTAENKDATSNGATAGLGRWVGGELIAVKNGATSFIPNYTTTTEGEDTITTPNSIHYVWGEKATAIPTFGRISYNLFAATQPTYTGTTQSSEGGTFNGTLAINFAPQSDGAVGTYNFAGTVTMPQVTQTETGPATSTATYNISTMSPGVTIKGNSFNNMGNLAVTASQGAIACPNGCTGTINAGGFGQGMNTVGTLYNINPNGDIGINGAALFTAAP